ncbi:OB-fold protein [Pasteurella multocida]|uniref:OB-fold protein n=1 Tax=Pasteurella multocida TaxID=747 RepID=UPI0013F3DECC|nr:hypothetical protein [Pasteurella multocida]
MKKILSLLCTTLFITSCAELNSVLDSVNKTIEDTSNPKLKSVSAIKICEDFINNEITAKKHWVGAYISVKAKIDSIYQDEWGDSNVNLKINHKTRVLATLKKGYSTEKFKKGHSVNIRGIVSNVMHTGTCSILLDKAVL